MGGDLEKYNEITHYDVIVAYLYKEYSHRKIQLEILNLPAEQRGGGFVAMKFLHYYNIHGDKKGTLKRNKLEDEIINAKGMYKVALEIIKKYK